jgi:hypothetical protein
MSWLARGTGSSSPAGSPASQAGQSDRDLFQLHLVNVLVAAMGDASAANVTVYAHAVDRDDLWRVHVRPSSFPVDAKVTVDNKGQFEKRTAFYVRLANGTREITDPPSGGSTSPPAGSRQRPERMPELVWAI